MKKLFMTLFILMLLACAFTVCVSAAEYYTEWGETETISNIGIEPSNVIPNYQQGVSEQARVKLKCTCSKGYHTYPTYYIMSINQHLYDLFNRTYDVINDTNPCEATYDKNSIIALEIPEGIGSTYYSGSGRGSTLSQHDNLEYIKLPKTMRTIAKYTFADNTKLEFVEFNKNSNIKTLGASAFNGSYSLVGVALPDSITTFEDACFIGCYNLGPVYLPKNLTNLGTITQWNTFQGGENGNGAKPTKMYFTDEFFTNPDEATKPRVYFMPSTLTYMDQGIRGASSINDVIVFPATYTSVSHMTTFLGLGATAEHRKAIVFLGDMTSIPFYQDPSLSYVDFYFLNPNDNLTVGGNNFVEFNRQGGSGAISETYLHSCTDGKSLNIVNTFSGEKVWKEELFKHLVDDRKTVPSEADCVNNKKNTTYCFCGDLIGAVEVENTALGHDNDLSNGAQVVLITYTDYTKNGYKTIKCARCNENNNDTEAEALINCLGYSSKKDGSSVCIGYSVNDQAINEYRTYNPSFTYGVVAYIPIGNENPLKVENDAVAVIDPAHTIFAQIGDIFESCEVFDFVIKGFAGNEDLAFVMGAYVFDGSAAYYLCIDAETGKVGQDENAKTISFQRISDFLNA